MLHLKIEVLSMYISKKKNGKDALLVICDRETQHIQY